MLVFPYLVKCIKILEGLNFDNTKDNLKRRKILGNLNTHLNKHQNQFLFCLSSTKQPFLSNSNKTHKGKKRLSFIHVELSRKLITNLLTGYTINTIYNNSLCKVISFLNIHEELLKKRLNNQINYFILMK